MASPSCNDAQLREKARKERERIAQTSLRARDREQLTAVPEFGPIIKEPKANDALHQKIASVLGSYDDKAKALIQKSSFYLGVDDEATTPASPIVASKGGFITSNPSGKDLQKKRIDLPNGSQKPRNLESKTDFKADVSHSSSSSKHHLVGRNHGLNGKPIHSTSHNSKTTSSPGAKNCQQNQKFTPPSRGNNPKSNVSASLDYHKQRTPTLSELSTTQHCTPQNQRTDSPAPSTNNNQKMYPSASMDSRNQRTPPASGWSATEQCNQQNLKFTPPSQNTIPSQISNHKANTSVSSDNHRTPTLSGSQKDKIDHSPRIQPVTKDSNSKGSTNTSPEKICKKHGAHKSGKMKKQLEHPVKNVKKRTGSDDSIDLEVIQEITTVSTPVSDIQTPKKEDSTGSLAASKRDPSVSQNGTIKEGSSKSDGRTVVTGCMSEGTPQLNADLQLSSSDSESEAEQTSQADISADKHDTRPANCVGLPKPMSHHQNMASANDLSDSSSDSSSDGSETDSSSSSSEEEEDVDEHQDDLKKPDDNKNAENWNLKNWIPNTTQPILPIEELNPTATKADIPLLDNNEAILNNLLQTISTSKEVSPLDRLDSNDPTGDELVDELLLNGSGHKCDVGDQSSPIDTKSKGFQCLSSKPVNHTKSTSSSSSSSKNGSSSSINRVDGGGDSVTRTGPQKKSVSSEKATTSHDSSYNGAKSSVPNKVINSTHVTCNAKLPTNAVQQSPSANKTKKVPAKVATKPAVTKRSGSSASRKSASTKKATGVSDKDMNTVSGAKGKNTPKTSKPAGTVEKKMTVNKAPVKRTNQGSKQTNSQTQAKKNRWEPKEYISPCDSSSSSLSSSGSSPSSHSSSSSSSSESSDSECELDQCVPAEPSFVQKSTAAHAEEAHSVAPYLGRSPGAASIEMSGHEAASPSRDLETSGTKSRHLSTSAINSNTSLDLDDELFKAPPQLLSPICPTPDVFPGQSLSPKLQTSTKVMPPHTDETSPVSVPYKEDNKPSIMVHLDLSRIKHILIPKDTSRSTSSMTSSNKQTPTSHAVGVISPGSTVNRSSTSEISTCDSMLGQSKNVPMDQVHSVTRKNHDKADDGVKPPHPTVTPSPEGKSAVDHAEGTKLKAKNKAFQSSSTSPANIQQGSARSRLKTGQEEKAVIDSILGTTDKSPLSLTIPKRKLPRAEPDNYKKMKTDSKSTPSKDGSKHKDTAAETTDKRQSGALRETAKSWARIAAHFDENPQYPANKYVERRKGHTTVEPLQYRLQPADYYLQEARRLKHEAEGRSQSRISKLMMYLEAVLSFVQCGYAMEKETSELNNKGVFNMYKETFKFSRDILKGSRHEHVDALEYKLIVLSFRLQSLLCLKLFKLKKVETSKLKSIMDEYYRSAASKVPSPCQPGTTVQGRPGTTGTPSPMSQQSSPAGSINSVGSGGSAGSDHVPRLLNNGTCNSSLSASNTVAGVSNSTVAIPSRIHSVSQSYLTYMDYLYQCHDIWDQADHLVEKCKGFFQELDRDCKPLSLHSSILEVVRYVKEGIHRLRQSLPPSSSSSS